MDPSDNMESSDAESVGVNGGGVATFWVASITKSGMNLCLRRNVWGSMMYITPVLRS
jgi:hypothetical protein